jgi:succinate dehydrogenase subunit D
VQRVNQGAKFTAEPFVWLLFTSGGMVAALVLPVLLLLFGVLFPLGWITPPDHDQMLEVLRNPLVRLGLLGVCALALVHAAHRIRFTVDHGLKLQRYDALIATACYGGAALVSVFAAHLLLIKL